MRVEGQVRRRLRVTGTVQGVGFRPFVHAVATRLGLSGFVLNDSAGVVIEIEGVSGAVEDFLSELERRPPPLAAIDRVGQQEVLPTGESGFAIRASRADAPPRAPIPPDVAPCAECLAEIEDPRARRHRYPFTNCTSCGPRFTITTAIPYDRPNTTMAPFMMCEACASEYEDPADRRFHAQPIACPRCGPGVRLIDRGGRRMAGDPIALTAELLSDGRIIAVKGLGGFHLACDATNETAVAELRRRKHREEKPLALMVGSIDAARAVAHLSLAEERVLSDRRRSIVLVRRRSRSPVAESVAPGNRFLGMMLPYAPLHHMVVWAIDRPLVLTSGNVSDEPIAFQDDDAMARLGPIADATLVHDREIHIRCDDSVVRVLDGDEYPIRRSRGYAPEPLSVQPRFARPVLAAGPELKHTFCLGVEDRAILSQHIGDLENYEAMSAFVTAVEHFIRIFRVEPEVIAHDLHPEYLSTKWALEQERRTVAVQHHHAHVASCLADNGRCDRVIGLALDGTGFGDDGAIWGCEVLCCDVAHYERVAHLAYVPLPGGAAAIKEPWRMTAVYLRAAFGDRADGVQLPVVARTRPRWPALFSMADKRINAPATSSAGRLFDAASALCDVRDHVSYEGQAAAEFEQLADPTTEWAYPCLVDDGTVDGVELIAALADDLSRGRPPSEAAAAFHNGLAAALVHACIRARDRFELTTVALSGGTFQNLLLLERVRSGLRRNRFEVLVHRRVPPNDGGISLGQAVIANALANQAPHSSWEVR